MGAVRKYERIEALAISADLDAALHASMRARGELLIDPRHLERAHRVANSCAVCCQPLTSRDHVAIRHGVLYCALHG